MLGNALHQYAFDHGRFPANLAALVTEGFATDDALRSAFRSSLSGDEALYRYIAGLTPMDSAGWPIAFDPPTESGKDETAVLFVSGSVQMLNAAEVEQVFAAFEEAYRAKHGSTPMFDRRGLRWP